MSQEEYVEKCLIDIYYNDGGKLIYVLGYSHEPLEHLQLQEWDRLVAGCAKPKTGHRPKKEEWHSVPLNIQASNLNIYATTPEEMTTMIRGWFRGDSVAKSWMDRFLRGANRDRLICVPVKSQGGNTERIKATPREKVAFLMYEVRSFVRQSVSETSLRSNRQGQRETQFSVAINALSW